MLDLDITKPNHLENTSLPSKPLTPTVTLHGDVKKERTPTRLPTKQPRCFPLKGHRLVCKLDLPNEGASCLHRCQRASQAFISTQSGATKEWLYKGLKFLHTACYTIGGGLSYLKMATWRTNLKCIQSWQLSRLTSKGHVAPTVHACPESARDGATASTGANASKSESPPQKAAQNSLLQKTKVMKLHHG
jgi:hypothetical protein